jgi:hypothetical protein
VRINAAIGLIFLLNSLGCAGERPVDVSWKSGPSSGFDEADRELWKRTVAVHLLDPLWIERDQYDAGHALMVPLHASFLFGDSTFQRQFANHFTRYMREGASEVTVTGNHLRHLQYFYLASWFVLLAEQGNRSDLIPDGLVDFLYREVRASWQERPAWQWARADFPGGIRERVNWKLLAPDIRKSYYPAITDEDLYVLAIAANLRAHERRVRGLPPSTPFVAEILDVARRVMNSRITVIDAEGGWLFQRGFWADHPDFLYAGRQEKIEGMTPAPLIDVAEDASHSHRWPMWLKSFAEAYPQGSADRIFYQELQRGLRRQFMTHVLVPADASFPAYRTTNYMDGRNGVYRWGYTTLGVGGGIGPYELSGTLTLGWWSFLGGDVKRVYAEMAQLFPLPGVVINTYMDRTTRQRHPLLYESVAYSNGYKELLVRLAAKLPEN